MKLKYPRLFEPIKIRNVLVKNRILGAPYGAWVFSPKNYVFDYALKAFDEMAKGGAASVCVGHTEVNASEGDSDGFGMYFDIRANEGTGALAEFAHAIQSHGCLANIELNYGGVYMPSHGGECYGPDGFVSPTGKVVHEMDKEKIDKTIRQYADCVKKMRKCGYKMVMLHGGHGWLPHQFFLSSTNHRTDEYGGSLENRMRFPIELAKACREAAGDDMIIEYRVSGIVPEENPEAFEELVALCNALGEYVDIINVSSGGEDRSTADGPPKRSHMFPSHLDPAGANLASAGPLKKRVKPFVCVVGAIYEPAFAEKVLADGIADFISMCRPLIADPELPNKARRGQEEDIRTCIGCYNCLNVMHETHIIACDINPRMGRQARIPEITPAKVSKKVAVVGGGPAGIKAAITADQRGHDVTLYEMTDSLGGLLRITDGNHIKRRLNNYKKYLLTQLEKSSVRIVLNTKVTPELMNAEGPDVIIVASGSEFKMPEAEGVELPNVYTSDAAHAHPEKLGDKVVIIGGNLNGCETALHMKHIGKSEVTVVGRNKILHPDAPRDQSLDYYLYEYGVETVTNAPCTKITEEGVYAAVDGKETFFPADSVVIATGRRSRFEVFEGLRLCAPDVIPIGDCVEPGTVRQTSRGGFFTALDI